MGAPELPGGPLHEAFPWIPALFGTILVGAALALVLLRARRPHPTPVAPEPPPPCDGPGPAEVAQRRLAVLREDAAARLHDELADTLRTYAAARWAVHGRQTTTEEFAAGVGGAIPPQPLALLHDVLLRCDLARFARGRSTEDDRIRLLDDAERLVLTTAPDGDLA